MSQERSFHEFVKSHDPLVSIVVPCYNKGEFVEATLQSALVQTYPFTEIVFVDDGSTDNSVEIASRVCRSMLESKRAIILQKANGGISDARNYALERVNGRVVTVLDGDDLMLPTYLEKAVRSMRQTGSNLVSTNVEIFGEEISEWVPQPYDPYTERYTNVIPTLVTYDREIWKEVGGYKKALVFNEDWDFFVGASARGLVVSRLEEKLFRYRVTHSGLAHNYIKDSWPRSVSLMMTSNNLLYPVEEVLWAHEQLAQMPQMWIDRFKKQDALHNREWLLKFWIGLAALGKGEAQEAKQWFNRAAELAPKEQWQPLLRLALLKEAMGDIAGSRVMLHQSRLLRPDLNRYVSEKISGAVKPDEFRI